MGRAAVALLALVMVTLLGAASAEANAGEIPSVASSDVGAKEVSINFISPNDHRNFLQLKLFPTKGVAVVDTYEGAGGRIGDSARDVAYAIAISPRPFDGSLDLTFPGLGRFVGTVVPDKPAGAATQAKLCESRNAEEYGTFEGHFAFRGAGGYGRWKADEAEVGTALACFTEPKRENGADALFEHVAEFGPSLSGPAPLQFSAQGEVRHRFIKFVAWALSAESDLQFVAIDREWLPGKVATERWVKKDPAPFAKSLELAPGGVRPASAVFTPPAPFFGKGTYLRRTDKGIGKLSGTLGVNFLGLKLHLTPSPLEAALIDEEWPEGPR